MGMGYRVICRWKVDNFAFDLFRQPPMGTRYLF
jgi:hypothetical protein